MPGRGFFRNSLFFDRTENLRIWRESMRKATIFLLGAFLLCACTACADMGRTFGKAGAKIEQKMDSFSEGYKEGREAELKKEQKEEKKAPALQEV